MDSTWTRYTERRAPNGILCQFMRPDGEPWVGTNDFGPMFNVGNLYWRLTGIGRKQLDAMNEQQRFMAEMYQNCLTGQGWQMAANSLTGGLSAQAAIFGDGSLFGNGPYEGWRARNMHAVR